MRIVAVVVVAAAACLAAPAVGATDAESIVRNGDFQKWTGGAPDHWMDAHAGGASKGRCQFVIVNG